MKLLGLSRVPFVVFLWGSMTVHAQTVATWSSNSDQRWSGNANWSGNNRPDTDSELAVFGTGAQHNVALDSNSYSVSGIIFSANAPSYTVTDNTGSRTLKLGGTTATAALVQQNSTQDQTIGIATLSLQDPTVLDTPGAGQLTISSAFSGSQSLEKTGTGGDVILSGNSRNFSGNIYVTAGTLLAANKNALGKTTSDTFVADGGTLGVGATSGLSIGEAVFIAGNGAGGNGALRNIANTNTLSGPITLTSSARIEASAGALNLTGGISGAGQIAAFGGSGNINVSGAIATGGVVKDGTGALQLSNSSNSITGPTAINAGTIVAAAANVFNNSAPLSIASGAMLSLGYNAQTIGSLSGGGTLELGGTGTGSLALSGGSGIFSGQFSGNGTIVIGAGATLTLAADFDAPNVNFTLAGGTLVLDGSTSTFGRLDITGNSILDFGNTTASVLTVSNLAFQNSGLQLTIQNWVGLSDYFYVQNFTGATPDVRGATPQNQISFAGFSSNSTAWNSWDHQITPAPEPATYGLLLLSASLGLVGWRTRRRSRRHASRGSTSTRSRELAP